MESNKKLKKNNGITLISLVITVIIMLILAGVSISLMVGTDSFFMKTEKIADEYKQDSQEEEEKIVDLQTQVEKYTKKPGDVTSIKLKETAVLSNWDSSKVKAIISEDKVTVPVPNGYTYSMIVGERNVSTGFVIKEGTNGAAKSGTNEFVWVPVNKNHMDDIYDETNNAGQLWSFSGSTSTKITYPDTQNSGQREPDVITGASEGSDSTSGSSYDAISTNLQQAGLSSSATVSDFKVQLQNEFDEMIESVEKYGGFYIGRYETGNLSQSIAVVQKGNKDISNQTWYTMYKLNKTIAGNEDVVSSMIWGCQWDATLRWMQTSEVEKVKNFATNSALYGNYKDNSVEYIENGETKTNGSVAVIPTGSAEITNINNIYDMSGNVWDWTLKAYSSDIRITRGGGFESYGWKRPANSKRTIYYSGEAYYNVGSRATLYIAVN